MNKISIPDWLKAQIIMNPRDSRLPFWQWYLDNLKPMKPKRLSGNDEQYVDDLINQIKKKTRMMKYPKMGYCFLNAYLLSAISGGKIEYCEGLYWSSFYPDLMEEVDYMPFNHGWNKLGEKVFDITYQWNCLPDDDGESYYGIILDTSTMKELGYDNGTKTINATLPLMFAKETLQPKYYNRYKPYYFFGNYKLNARTKQFIETFKY